MSSQGTWSQDSHVCHAHRVALVQGTNVVRRAAGIGLVLQLLRCSEGIVMVGSSGH